MGHCGSAQAERFSATIEAKLPVSSSSQERKANTTRSGGVRNVAGDRKETRYSSPESLRLKPLSVTYR